MHVEHFNISGSKTQPAVRKGCIYLQAFGKLNKTFEVRRLSIALPQDKDQKGCIYLRL